ncbi:MAG TPA: isoleucine--tRNA ligase [Terriglobia bacterium]|nr:isoleucine--tRNA ligase [Terriglobia bacterium]
MKVEPKPAFPELEKAVLQRWQTEQTFEQSLERTRTGPEFVFYDGPPFPTGSPHYGTIFVSILKDVVPRYKTMRGFYVPRTWGWDCHGLPVETQAEKNLGIKDKREIEQRIGVKAFNDECRKIVSTFNAAWKVYIDRIGRWVDFDHPYQTLDASFMESVLWAFAEIYKKDLIYKDFRVSPYCYRCQTALSVSDTRMDDATRMKQDRAITVKFKVRGLENTFFIAWTTTPWTLPSNLALAVGSNIPYVWGRKDNETYIFAKSALARYKKELEGVEIVRELTGRELAAEKLRYEPLFPYFDEGPSNRFQVLEADFVGIEDGTGIVHLAPAFGEDDYWACRRANIAPVCPVDEQGCFTSEVRDFAPRNVHDANADIIRYLKNLGRVIKDETLEHNYPHCWRCRTALIYKALDAWYLNVEKIKDRLIACNQEISWYPETVKHGRFGKWLENARDWNISRNRYWATPIPVWECGACKKRDVPSSIAELEQRAKHPVTDLHKEYLDAIVYTCDCGGTMKRTPEVLDGWFESGSMPYGQFHYPFERAEHFRSHFPADFIVEYPGQIRGWFYVLHVLSTALFDRPAFRNCLVHGTLLAADGKKISKSLKNYTDPLELMDRYGADSLRMYLLSSSAVQIDDLNFRDEGVEAITRTILLPIWNALSFFASYAAIDGVKPADLANGAFQLEPLDRFILSETEILVTRVTDSMDRYSIHDAAQQFPPFLDTLNNWYIRRSRARVWSADPREPGKMAFYATLYRVLSRVTALLAPFCPFVTESVWQRLGYTRSVHLEDWPQAESQYIDEQLSQEVALARTVITAGLAIRAREKIRVRQPLSKARVALSSSVDISKQTSAVMQELNVKTIEFVKNASEIADRVAKAQAKKLGPKYGGAVQGIIKDLKEGRFNQSADGTVSVGQYLLLPDEVEISFVGKQGLSVQSENGAVVALSTEITPELELEGDARDLVRVIQDLRKEAGFEFSDRITLGIEGGDDIVTAHRDYISNETLATSVVTEAQQPQVSRTVEIGKRSIRISLAKDGRN